VRLGRALRETPDFTRPDARYPPAVSVPDPLLDSSPMEAWVARLIEWFALPANGLSSVFVIAFISATLLPMGSEPAVFGYAKLNPEQFWLVIAVATVGNTLGGMVDYWLGWGAHQAVARNRASHIRWLERLGPKALFFSWLPLVGDPLCAVAGWLKMAFWPCVAWMAVGKLLRYLLMTSLLLWVPDGWWRDLFGLFAR
jgi:membrane protein YqaA with SNARE-associated domain